MDGLDVTRKRLLGALNRLYTITRWHNGHRISLNICQSSRTQYHIHSSYMYFLKLEYEMLSILSTEIDTSENVHIA